MANDILFAIPARGGSKRLPRKNLVTLGGKPMIAYTIEAAIRSELSEHIYVCTEDEEISKIALRYGAKVYELPGELAGDDVSSTVPCLELYKHLSGKKERLEYLFNLQPTSPLRNHSDIINAFQVFQKTDANYLVSTTFIDPHYFHWALQYKDNSWEMYFGKQYLRERTQLPPVYRPNGAIKLARAAILSETGNFFGPGLQTYEMPEERSIHVATEFDLKVCETIINIK